MGNWRTVNLQGTCDQSEVDALKKAITFDMSGEFPNDFHCLMNTCGLYGIGDWPASTILASGNLAERDYSVDDVAETLRRLVVVAPSLRLKVHCGDDYESERCVATITVSDGEISVGQPEVESVAGASGEQVRGRLLAALIRPRN